MRPSVRGKRWIVWTVLLIVSAVLAPAQAREDVKITPDVVYGHKDGMALTMDVSPLLNASADDAPALMIHGDKDVLVPLWHSEKMHEAFEEKGVPSDLLVIEGAAHGFTGPDGRRAGKASVAWFRRHLLGDRPKGERKATD